jgi:hypothetical protein
MLLNMVVSAQELEPAKKELTKHQEEVKALAYANIKLNQQARELADQYEYKYANFT